MDFTSQFQTEDGRILSIIDLFGKVQQLEKRLSFVEENYSPKPPKEEIELEIVPEKEVGEMPISETPKEEKKLVEKIAFSVPKKLPKNLEELKALFIKVEEEKVEAKRIADFALHADLDYDSKKIAHKIKTLVDTKDLPEAQNVAPLLDITPAPQQKKKYPASISALKAILEHNIKLKEEATISKNSTALLEIEAEDKKIKNYIRNLEMAKLYGKSDDEKEEIKIEDEDKEEGKKVNKRLVFEIEQDILALRKSKKKAISDNNPTRLTLLSDKESMLKEELELAEKGEIQERWKEEEISRKKEETQLSLGTKKTEVVTNVVVGKTVNKTKKEAVKKVKVIPQGPTELEQFLAPLYSGIAALKLKYDEAKKEGNLPIFFLSIAGIVTMLLGFGYLAQYTTVNYLGNYLTQVKVGVGLVCSTAAIFIGIRLIAKDKKFAAFGASLMGLGLSLNYLFIYFLSAAPPLVSTTVGFLLIFVNTAVSVFMSLRYNSKIIAVLALFGGALAPSYLNSSGENTEIYFAYLWVLCAAAAFIGHRLRWELINFISFVLVVLILGSNIYLKYSEPTALADSVYLLLFHAFAYLYAYISLFDGLAPKKKQTSLTIITLIGAQAAMMMSLYYIYGNQKEAYAILGTAYLLNILPFAAITVVFYDKWTEQQKTILIGISSAFIAAAIPAYLGIAYRGLLWAIEGLVLLAGGLILKLPIVRRLSYSVLVASLVNMFFNLHALPNRFEGILLTKGYINLWSIGFILIGSSFLFKKYEESLADHEKRLPYILHQVISVWAVAVFYITTYFYCSVYLLAFMEKYIGIFWTIQGVLVLAIGLHFKQITYRLLSYLLLILGASNMLDNLTMMPDRSAGILFTQGYINLWVLGFVLIAVTLLLKQYKKALTPSEAKLPEVVAEVLAVWGMVIFYITAFYFFSFYAFNLALIPMFVLLLWNNYKKLYIAEFLGLGQVFVLFYVIMLSIGETHSYHFSDQELYGQLAMIEVMFVLWVLELFYEKAIPNAPQYKHDLAKSARILCYVMLPIGLLDAFYHGLPGYILYGMWLMCLLTFLLAEFTKSKSVLVEFLGFVVLSALFSFAKVDYGALLVGNSLLLGICYYKKAWTEAAFEKRDYQILYFLAPYFAIASVGLVYAKASGEDIFSALFICMALVLTLVNLGHKLAPVRRSLDIAYRLVFGVTILTLFSLFSTLEHDAPRSIWIGFLALTITLGWFHKMIYKADIPYNGDKKSPVWKVESIALHALNIAFYTTFVYFITGTPASIVLTVCLFLHAIALVFNGLKPGYQHFTKIYIGLFIVSLIKLFLVDMRDTEMVMKIIVFIGLGMICLVAAYFLIKNNKKNKGLDTEIEVETQKNMPQ
jgi:hypothetical protein